jgi:hypothetical protein
VYVDAKVINESSPKLNSNMLHHRLFISVEI